MRHGGEGVAVEAVVPVLLLWVILPVACGPTLAFLPSFNHHLKTYLKTPFFFSQFPRQTRDFDKETRSLINRKGGGSVSG